jgi:hypothetical protein
MTEPGVFEWTSPHGHRYRRDQAGTTALDEGLVTGAGAPSSTSKGPPTQRSAPAPTMTPPHTPPATSRRGHRHAPQR